MEMIREESIVRDRPIYLQFSDHCNFSNSIWYVIEEKDTDLTTIEEEVEEICRQTDKIRELEVPRIISPSGSLIVFNSRIYILGGYLYEDYGDYMFKCYGKLLNDGDLGDWEGVSKNVFYYDTKNPGKKDWKKGPTLSIDRYDQVVAALENSGIFVAFGPGRSNFEFLDDSLNGIWWPSLPAYLEIKMTRLLAVTDTKVYIHCIGFDGFRNETTGMSYDVQNSEWNIFDKNFQGWWSPGVVLHFNSNPYLFVFGKKVKNWTIGPTEEYYSEEFCVYDLNNSSWLPSTVEGLTKDGKTLPIEEGFVEEYEEVISHKYLLRMNQENKLALVWSKQSPVSRHSSDVSTKIHCTKFNIICTFKSNSQLPIFSAQVVSFGSFHVKDNIALNNCAASLTGEDKKKFGLSKEWNEI